LDHLLSGVCRLRAAQLGQSREHQPVFIDLVDVSRVFQTRKA
jgi:hypothetical protein